MAVTEWQEKVRTGDGKQTVSIREVIYHSKGQKGESGPYL